MSFRSFFYVTVLFCTTMFGQENKGFKLGGYAEVVFGKHFYSDNWKRYSHPESYKDDGSFSRVDIPHFTLTMENDFGNGWRMGSEIEFEHGGIGAAVEIEEEETGEYESEIEKGGEVNLEEMWIEKSFSKKLNLRMGHVVVPVGAINADHDPTRFFENYRPEGQATLFPCTWHQTGVSLWGYLGHWKYTFQLLPGLDAFMFDDAKWIHKGATSPFEFKIANGLASAFRIDNHSIKNLRLSISGYYGKSGINTLKRSNYKGINGNVSIISFDASYSDDACRVRTGADYGHLTDSYQISVANKQNRKDSPSPKRNIGSDAINIWAEAGYDIFHWWDHLSDNGQRLFIFGKFNYYDSMFRTEKGIIDNPRFEKKIWGVGLNYFPMKQIVVKAEYNSRNFASPINTENSILVGFAFSGWFVK